MPFNWRSHFWYLAALSLQAAAVSFILQSCYCILCFFIVFWTMKLKKLQWISRKNSLISSSFMQKPNIWVELNWFDLYKFSSRRISFFSFISTFCMDLSMIPWMWMGQLRHLTFYGAFWRFRPLFWRFKWKMLSILNSSQLYIFDSMNQIHFISSFVAPFSLRTEATRCIWSNRAF